ncbi:helix-turn-helix transcriptional regulator [Plectonema cf. radiosum LEGE 06105]|uniref:Helix-turn-helix transcriptional regulator n=1 Tax=Plectonema cf. radiosum LEGE 06105 TaxID=945769 RepID=A0A8J7EYY7_9CYAN|nr:AraC family transcriptional regulator [Plectonema radiosum]MBE9211532.1 helix-turn-helix transcriptional regulator [Plectonema cf. radiosum LEGE 06105]
MPQPKQQTNATIIKAEWSDLIVEYGRMEKVGEFDFTMPKNAISVVFAPHERVTWSVDGGKLQTTSLPAGSIFLYSQREFVWHRREKESEYVNLLLEPQLINQLADDNGITTTIELEHRVIFPDPTILHVAQLLKSEVVNGGLSGNLYVESLRNLLAIHLLRNYTGTEEKSSPEVGVLDSLKLKEIKDYIEENLAEELAIANLAALVPMSEFHFARTFKSLAKEPPHRYILKRRIERAKILLEVTRFSAAEIAYQVGFSNPSHFTAQFRKLVGVTPKVYRNSF